MPRVSVWLLRISLVSLLVGATAGSWLLAREPWGSAWLPRLRAAHVHLMLFGWLLPFVLGTAYWMLPKHAEGEERGSVGAGVTGAGLIGAGTVAGLIGALISDITLQRLGTLGVVGGVALFIVLLWPRIKQFGQGRESVPPKP